MRTKYIIYFLFFCAYICAGCTTLYSIHNRYDKKGRVYWHGSKNEKKVAFTFDDGPSENTPQILDTLKKFNVKATFFVVGKNVEKFPETFKRLVQEGHTIGNHSYSHPYMFIKSASTIRNEIKKTEEIVRKFSDKKMFLLRTPYGVENPWVFQEARKSGYVIVKWSVSGSDWKTKNAEAIVKKVVNNAQNGSIINLHDGRRLKKKTNCQATINALSMIIANLKEKGYQFVTVPQLLGIKQERLSTSMEGSWLSYAI